MLICSVIDTTLLACEADLAEKYWDFLSETRRNRITNMHFPEAIAQSIGAELALMHAYRLTGHTGDFGAYTYDAKGKPLRRDGLYMSLSHTQGVSVCALSDAPVGVDVEKSRKI